MMRTFTLALCAFVVALIAVVLAASANADADDERAFIQEVQQQMPTVLARYGTNAMIAEGYRVCMYNQREDIDRDYSGELDRIIMEMPMSRHEAIKLTNLAPVYLGCDD
jgi:hypothetical protein